VIHELTELPPSRASPLPQLDLCASGRGVACVLGQRWELACLRWHQLVVPDTQRCLHRRQASSHRKAKHCGAGSCTRSTCGSGLARESGGPVTHELTEPPPSRASPLPQLDLCASGRGVACVLGQRWELACLRWHQPGVPDRPRCLHRRQARSHRKAALLVLAPLKSAPGRWQKLSENREQHTPNMPRSSDHEPRDHRVQIHCQAR